MNNGELASLESHLLDYCSVAERKLSPESLIWCASWVIEHISFIYGLLHHKPDFLYG